MIFFLIIFNCWLQTIIWWKFAITEQKNKDFRRQWKNDSSYPNFSFDTRSANCDNNAKSDDVEVPHLSKLLWKIHAIRKQTRIFLTVSVTEKKLKISITFSNFEWRIVIVNYGIRLNTCSSRGKEIDTLLKSSMFDFATCIM